jgi:uncharacterized membrane protein
MAVLHAGTYDLVGVATTAAVFSLWQVVIVDRRVGWLATAVESSSTALADATVRRHHGLAQRTILVVIIYAALSALVALLATGAIIPSGLIVMLPAMMIAQGVWSLVRAVRVRSWERNRNSELLISSGCPPMSSCPPGPAGVDSERMWCKPGTECKLPGAR